ncbi:hypothetical protein SISNIDRAFT_491409 [Sistotremastrum niveocremeum HHB9708]|uniref:Uncharacterized protein n=1 Tax=Sistotremastrum niveocremeum HHB9708 TaxID=1314777 RepID=A0A164MUY4_9AGAM|nr:hypothetical protein SISNIDRAFT_491409 [Sistotremastrum niveocremeum HHB9708]
MSHSESPSLPIIPLPRLSSPVLLPLSQPLVSQSPDLAADAMSNMINHSDLLEFSLGDGRIIDPVESETPDHGRQSKENDLRTRALHNAHFRERMQGFLEELDFAAAELRFFCVCGIIVIAVSALLRSWLWCAMVAIVSIIVDSMNWTPAMIKWLSQGIPIGMLGFHGFGQ